MGVSRFPCFSLKGYHQTQAWGRGVAEMQLMIAYFTEAMVVTAQLAAPAQGFQSSQSKTNSANQPSASGCLAVRVSEAEVVP